MSDGFSKQEVIEILTAVAEVLGRRVFELAANASPKLDLGELSASDEDMFAAEREAEARLTPHVAAEQAGADEVLVRKPATSKA